MRYGIVVSVIFLGSVFLTSDKFVGSETEAKFYFTIITVLIGIIAVNLRNTSLRSEVQKLTSLFTQKGLFAIGVLQAIYGVLQYTGTLASNHSSFAVTGSFDNPAGFVAVLSLLTPIGVYWGIRSKGLEQLLILISVGLILISIIVSGSRTGMLGCVISISLVPALELQLLSKIKNSKYAKITFLLSIIILL